MKIKRNIFFNGYTYTFLIIENESMSQTIAHFPFIKMKFTLSYSFIFIEINSSK